MDQSASFFSIINASFKSFIRNFGVDCFGIRENCWFFTDKNIIYYNLMGKVSSEASLAWRI